MSTASHQLKVIINSTLSVEVALAKLKAQRKVAMTQFDVMVELGHVTLLYSYKTATRHRHQSIDRLVMHFVQVPLG